MKKLELREEVENMSIQLDNSVIKVLRDEDDNYFTYLVGNVFNTHTNQTEGKFYLKRKIKLANNQEVKNKSKIKILNGFVSPYKIKVKDENNQYSYINGEIYYIKDFQLIEDGISEKQRPFRKITNQQEQPRAKEDKNAQKLNSFSFNEYNDVTPF